MLDELNLNKLSKFLNFYIFFNEYYLRYDTPYILFYANSEGKSIDLFYENE